MNHRIAVSAVVLVGLAACARPGVDERAFEWSDQLPAGAVVHVRDGSGDIIVRRAAGASAVVTASRRWRHGRSSDIRFAVSQSGNDYYVCAMWRGSGKCGASGYHGRRTSSFLTMFSLFHHSSDTRADFVAEVPANVVIDATTANGSVHVTGMIAGVTARTVNGNVEASDVSGPLTLSTTNGSVRLSADSLADTDAIHLSTTNGAIRAQLPANLQGNFDLSTVNGVVNSDFPISPASQSRAGHHLQGQVGSSSRVVKMRTINGVVSVTSRAGAASH